MNTNNNDNYLPEDLNTNTIIKDSTIKEDEFNLALTSKDLSQLKQNTDQPTDKNE